MTRPRSSVSKPTVDAPDEGPRGLRAADGQVPEASETLDTRLLEGFRFSCRPDCGLCCFAAPHVEPEERTALLRLDPKIVLEDSEPGWSTIAQRGPGGACGLLTKDRCRLHAARPSPCRLFPIHVHVGQRPQATLVLSCPGLDLSVLSGGPAGRRSPPDPPVGLDSELEALGGVVRLADSDGLLTLAQREYESALRKARRRTGWIDGVSWRTRLIQDPPAPFSPGTVASDDPYEADGLDMLPIFKDERHGIVAMAAAEGGWELLQLDPEGGVRERLGLYGGPESSPKLAPDGAGLLRGYLSYLAARDATVDGVLYDWLDDRAAPGTFPDAVRDELRRAGLQVLTRAVLRARLEGRPGEPLDASDVGAGIRATDAELLDRPVVGTAL